VLSPETLTRSRVHPAARATSGPTVAALLLAMCVFGTGFGEPKLVENFTVVDLAIAGLGVVMVLNAVAGTTRVADVARRLAPAATLILVGTVVASMHVGLTRWIVGDLVRDLGIALAFIAAVDVARREGLPALRWCGLALAASTTIVSAHLTLFDSGLRARATFPNPNVAGHFLATAVIGLQALPMRPWLRRGVTVLALVALARTSSFGALLQVAVGTAALTAGRLRARPGHRPHVFAAGVVVAGVLAIVGVLFAPRVLPEENDGTALSSSRLEKSAGGRFDIWGDGFRILSEHPLGVGPGSTNGLELLETEQELHNEPLAYLVERGPLGLAGFLVLGVALWSIAARGGVARALLVGFGLSSIVRETSHYRHLWVVLALALVADEHRRSRDGAG
jgi:hypothetical protein